MNSVDLLAKCHQANGDYKSAAYTLSSFKFDDFKSDWLQRVSMNNPIW